MAGHTRSPGATPSSSAKAEFNAADLMFAAMMIPHHEQAVMMSDMVLAKKNLDPAVRELAEQIKAAQQPEIDTMNGWLKVWGTRPDHSEMDHGSNDSGMMTPRSSASVAPPTPAGDSN